MILFLIFLLKPYFMVNRLTKKYGSSASFFYDENGSWKLLSWSPVWSSLGTADGFMFPCYF